MIITFTDKERIIKHESGYRDICTKNDLENIKKLFQEFANQLTDYILILEQQILEIDKCVVKKL
jgi:hypothetical protein